MADDSVAVSTEIVNRGEMDSDEMVQLYLAQEDLIGVRGENFAADSSVTRATKESQLQSTQA